MQSFNEFVEYMKAFMDAAGKVIDQLKESLEMIAADATVEQTPPRYHPEMGSRIHRNLIWRLDLCPWYTSGFQ